MRSILYLISVALFLIVTKVPSIALQQDGPRVALVVGNSAYKFASRLSNPEHDSVDISNMLRRLGFDTIKGNNLDKAGFENAIKAFSSKLEKARIGLFFFAGHAIQIAGNNYLLPVDAQLPTQSTLEIGLVNLRTIQRVMEEASLRGVMFLDACRNNPFEESLGRGLGPRMLEIEHGLAPVSLRGDMIIAYSTEPGAIAQDGKGRNSPYTTALLKYLSRPELDIYAQLMEVHNEVVQVTDGHQVPWLHSSLSRLLFLSGYDPKSPDQPKSDSLSKAEASEKTDRDGISNLVTNGNQSPICNNNKGNCTIQYGR